jgi:hypothetical protein
LFRKKEKSKVENSKTNIPNMGDVVGLAKTKGSD